MATMDANLGRVAEPDARRPDDRRRLPQRRAQNVQIVNSQLHGDAACRHAHLDAEREHPDRPQHLQRHQRVRHVLRGPSGSARVQQHTACRSDDQQQPVLAAAATTDGVQIIGNAYGVQVGPGNEFTGLAQTTSGAHTDPIQLYGSSHTLITGNYICTATRPESWPRTAATRDDHAERDPDDRVSVADRDGRSERQRHHAQHASPAAAGRSRSTSPMPARPAAASSSATTSWPRSRMPPAGRRGDHRGLQPGSDRWRCHGRPRHPRPARVRRRKLTVHLRRLSALRAHSTGAKARRRVRQRRGHRRRSRYVHVRPAVRQLRQCDRVRCAAVTARHGVVRRRARVTALPRRY